jgi:hypothetical protein
MTRKSHWEIRIVNSHRLSFTVICSECFLRSFFSKKDMSTPQQIAYCDSAHLPSHYLTFLRYSHEQISSHVGVEHQKVGSLPLPSSDSPCGLQLWAFASQDEMLTVRDSYDSSFFRRRRRSNNRDIQDQMSQMGDLKSFLFVNTCRNYLWNRRTLQHKCPKTR